MYSSNGEHLSLFGLIPRADTVHFSSAAHGEKMLKTHQRSVLWVPLAARGGDEGNERNKRPESLSVIHGKTSAVILAGARLAEHGAAPSSLLSLVVMKGASVMCCRRGCACVPRPSPASNRVSGKGGEIIPSETNQQNPRVNLRQLHAAIMFAGADPSSAPRYPSH